METLTLTYGATSKVYRVLSVKGMDDFDELEFHNTFINTSDNGELFENYDAWRRVITIEFDILTQAERTHFFNFMVTMNTKVLVYGSYTISVVNYDANGFANEWLEGLKTAKKFTQRFKEKTALTTVPAF